MYIETVIFAEGGVPTNMQNKNEKRAYAKPTVLAATKQNSNFSAGCASKTGMMCRTCRCS